MKSTSRQSRVAKNLLICCLLMTINGISMINVETIKFLLHPLCLFPQFNYVFFKV